MWKKHDIDATIGHIRELFQACRWDSEGDIVRKQKELNHQGGDHWLGLSSHYLTGSTAACVSPSVSTVTRNGQGVVEELHD
jgi:hypothetical protein